MTIDINFDTYLDLEKIADKVFYPLTGFMTEKDFKSVVKSMRLESGQLFPLPVSLNKKNCTKFNGVNLFDSSLKTDLPYYIYVPPNASSNHKFENHISIKIPSRNISLLDAMKDSEVIELSEEKEKNASEIINKFEK